MGSRTAVITGAGSGIGRAVARAFVEDGFLVYASDVSEERLKDLARELDFPSTLRTACVDVSDYGAVTALTEQVVADTGTLDALINCAGVFDGYADILETTPELWSRIIAINLSGVYNGCRAAAQIMVKQQSGRIITIGSIAGQRGAADGLAYAASKAGVEGLNRRLAIDVGPHNVTANVVAPGVTRTGLRATSEELLGDLVPDQQRGIGVSPQTWDFLIPAKRSADPAEIAALVSFLASDSASYINGQVIAVDGGWTAT